MEKIKCTIERITFQNPENGYSVLQATIKGYRDEQTLVGTFHEVTVGAVLTVEGSWRVDKRYGRQFAVESWTEELPATVIGIEKYLGSGLVKGIGPKFAKQIVSHFGLETFEVIENNIDRLLEVPNIGKGRVAKIKEFWEKQKDVKDIMVFLQGHGVSSTYAAKIYKQYGKDSIYINVMNNLSIDCDCDGHPSAPQMKDIGILASTDPVALDKACLDLVFNHQNTSGDNASSFVSRIESLHGTHTVSYAEQGNSQQTVDELCAWLDHEGYTLRSRFPKGEPNVNYAQYFIHDSYLAPIKPANLSKEEKTVLPFANVTFEPGCRNNWHVHHGMHQILICVSGRGWYQEWGKDAIPMTPGTVIDIPEGVKHWHGAQRDSWFQHYTTHVATGGEQSNEWLEPVTDEIYNKLK